jgi:hypothetical protein
MNVSSQAKARGTIFGKPAKLLQTNVISNFFGYFLGG